MHLRLVPLLLVALLAGCASPAVDDTTPEPTLLIDPDRPDTETRDVATGPEVGPDLNATTAAAPRLVKGEWWRIEFESEMGAPAPPLVRVVANVTEDGYVMGMPHEGWVKEAISYHSPSFGDVTFGLGYDTHNELFEPVRFPLRQGDTWETSFGSGALVARVDAADQYTAEITFWPPEDDDATPDPMTVFMGLVVPDDGGPTMRLTYDARIHEIVSMDSLFGTWKVVSHGYDFEGWVTVPRAEHTAIDYSMLGPVDPEQGGSTRKVVVDGGFNRLTLLHAIIPIGPGSYKIRSVTPKGEEFLTESTGTSTAMVMKFYEAYNPDGEWTQEDTILGPGATYNMGIAYHQYDVHLPDGLMRADHAHPVIR